MRTLCKSSVFLLLLLVGWGSTVHSQTITVLDKTSEKPIQNVLIYNLAETKSALTDSLGKADIAEFSEGEHIVFSHTSYHVVIIKKRELYSTSYIFYLSPTVVKLEEFVVAANKRPQKKAEVPNEITTISPKDVELKDPQTSADMLASSGKIFVQKSQMGGGSPMIRGFSANRVLIVVDGARMNNAIFRSGNLQNVISVDPNLLGKSEVVYGPGSVIYGSDALGGVMDFYTMEPIFAEAEAPAIQLNAFARYASANNERTAHADFSIGTRKFNSTTSITYSKFADLKMGASGGPDEYLRREYVEVSDFKPDEIVSNPSPYVQISTGYSAWNLMQKFTWKASKKLTFDYRFLFSNTSDIPRYDRLLIKKDNGDLKYAVWKYGPQKWMMNNLQMNLNSPNGAFDNIHVTLAWQKFEEQRMDRKFQSETTRHRTESVDMFTLNLDFDNEISGRTFLYYGYEGVYNIVGSRASEVTTSGSGQLTNNIQTRYPNNSSQLTNAAYVNLKLNRDNRTTVVFGMRYSQVNINAKLDDTFYHFDQTGIKQNTGALTGSVGIAHRPKGKWQINVNLASGFRAPNIDDIAKVFDSEPGNVIVPNPELQAEYLYSLDALIGKGLGKNEEVKLELSGFFSYLVNAMVRDDFQLNGQDSIIYDGELSRVQAIVNTGSASVTGARFSVLGDVSKSIQLTGNFTYTYGIDDRGESVRHVPPIYSDLHFVYSYKLFKLDAFGIFNSGIPNSRLAPSEKDKPYMYAVDSNGNPYSPWWYTLNLRTAFDIKGYVLITAAVENILDVRYRAYSSGIVGPGRNFIVSVKVHI